MAKHRTLVPVSYVANGKVVSVDADRVIDLDDKQAKSLAGKVVLVEQKAPSMFPEGAPIIQSHITRTVPATPVAGEAVEPEPQPKAEPKKFSGFKPEKPKS